VCLARSAGAVLVVCLPSRSSAAQPAPSPGDQMPMQGACADDGGGMNGRGGMMPIDGNDGRTVDSPRNDADARRDR